MIASKLDKVHGSLRVLRDPTGVPCSHAQEASSHREQAVNDSVKKSRERERVPPKREREYLLRERERERERGSLSERSEPLMEGREE